MKYEFDFLLMNNEITFMRKQINDKESNDEDGDEIRGISKK